MKYDNDSYKMSFFNHLKKLQTNYNTRTLLTKAMEEYNNRFQLAPSDRFDKEVENFARILASSTPINKISEVGLYALVYSKPNEQFTFLDSFPIIYCFNQSDIEHQTIAGINLNRLEKKHSLIYLKAQMKEKDLKVKQANEYNFLRMYGSKKSPYRKFSQKGIIQAWKLNLNSLQYFDLSFMAKYS
jgi:hypothetical protein